VFAWPTLDITVPSLCRTKMNTTYKRHAAKVVLLEEALGPLPLCR